MATSVGPQSAAPVLGFLSHPLHSLAVTLVSWRERRRERAGAALLMRLEPHMLKDIGVTLAEQRGARAMLKWHPVVLATAMKPYSQSREEEW